MIKDGEHRVNQKIIEGAPASSEWRLFSELTFLCSTTNCYAYAVQDYGAGYLMSEKNRFFLHEADGYLPRPGQTQGVSYEELYDEKFPLRTPKSTEARMRLMRQALKQDGVLYQGKKYPKFVPSDQYVICCFLEGNGYHFLRQNKDGSWSSKNGVHPVSSENYNHTASIENNPEAYYGYREDCPFVGYFFVPKGGVPVGVKAHLLKKRWRDADVVSWLRGEGIVPKQTEIIHFKDYLKKALPVFESFYGRVSEIRSIYATASGGKPNAKELENVLKIEKGIDESFDALTDHSPNSIKSVLFNKKAFSLKQRKKLAGR